ncbi:uncharacterized protein PgNI_01426 [Pyricularia grisea]|uniref:Major facilitator superfamily (MFS) profile domain-containing protein n=1 Tax=Pyricularia grisea TaxID=148305 RepID=A0A6P8BJD4_PYRGI|nr:uncharacterized protein PgNI_01426 [Pyricularia grisea]TLD16898.1 hypothetical protein PgNI_01426 [Pyricularia grisea]
MTANVPIDQQQMRPEAANSDGEHSIPDDGMASRVLRKIDRNLIPVLFVTYMLNFMDKTILSSASVFGLKEDNNLQGQDYSWVSSIFYFGYFMWTWPTSLLIARLPVAKYMTANTLFWGVAVAMTAACTNYGGLLTVRFFLGIAEATITPAFMFLTSTWYTRDEIPFRTGIWFSGNSVGGMFASIIAFGIGHIHDHVGPWRWMYIVLGCSTFLWASAIFYFLPDRISSARFLTKEEREFARDRVVVAGTGRTDKTVWRWDQFVECLADPKTWLFFCMELASQMPNGGTQNFANLVIRSFGFTSLQTTLINIPYSLLSASWIAGSGWVASRYRRANCLLIVAVVLPCIAGSSVIYSRASTPRAAHMVGYFLLSSGPAAMPLAMSLVQANYRGVTKKMTVTAMLFVAYCAGNIAGPHLFRADDAPTYNSAFLAIMLCYAVVVCLALTLRFYLNAANKRRAAEEGFEGDSGVAGAVGGVDVAKTGGGGGGAGGVGDLGRIVNEVELRPEDYEDVTDWKMVGFRYRL